MVADRECLEEQFVDLLDVQFPFWLMGRDAVHPRATSLVELGLTRERPTNPELPSRYTRTDEDTFAIWR